MTSRQLAASLISRLVTIERLHPPCSVRCWVFLCDAFDFKVMLWLIIGINPKRNCHRVSQYPEQYLCQGKTDFIHFGIVRAAPKNLVVAVYFILGHYDYKTWSMGWIHDVYHWRTLWTHAMQCESRKYSRPKRHRCFRPWQPTPRCLKKYGSRFRLCCPGQSSPRRLKRDVTYYLSESHFSSSTLDTASLSLASCCEPTSGSHSVFGSCGRVHMRACKL